MAAEYKENDDFSKRPISKRSCAFGGADGAGAVL